MSAARVVSSPTVAPEVIRAVCTSAFRVFNAAAIAERFELLVPSESPSPDEELVVDAFRVIEEPVDVGVVAALAFAVAVLAVEVLTVRVVA
jgi:hypothetical protein